MCKPDATMSKRYDSLESLASAGETLRRASAEEALARVVVRESLRRVGVVVHPNRNIEKPLRALREWTGRHGADLVQIPIPGQHHEVADHGIASECDLLVAIGGDGTALGAMRAAAVADRPVLGVACGSLGALTTVAADGITQALDRFSRGHWMPTHLPALALAGGDRPALFALNDIAIVRAGEGQVRATVRVDGVLFVRLAGDGCVVSTPIGSSAYSMAAGGPLIAPGTDAYILTPLPTHGGFCPPLLIRAGSELQLDTVAGHGGARLEIDGQVADTKVGPLRISFRRAVATVVSFADQEPFPSGLRRRRIIIDSPRILAEDKPADPLA
jgi:NAD+ kinase